MDTVTLQNNASCHFIKFIFSRKVTKKIKYFQRLILNLKIIKMLRKSDIHMVRSTAVEKNKIIYNIYSNRKLYLITF